MDTNEESSLYLRYKTSAVFIRKYLSDELVDLYEFRIKDKAPEDVLKKKYLCEYQNYLMLRKYHWKI